MPYWNRQAALDRAIAAYSGLYGHLDLEIVVCDDGSPEPVSAPGCVVVSLPRKGGPLNPCVPINWAVATASGDVIVLTNPEIVHTERTLDHMLVLLEDEMDYVVASCRDADGQWLAGDRVRYDRDGRLPVPPGAHFHFCAMLRRSLWDLVGGFDEDYRYGQGCDDNDWLWRLHRAGARFRLCESTVTHYRSGLRWGIKMNHEIFREKWPCV
jgi:hypothetical protein